MTSVSSSSSSPSSSSLSPPPSPFSPFSVSVCLLGGQVKKWNFHPSANRDYDPSISYPSSKSLSIHSPFSLFPMDSLPDENENPNAIASEWTSSSRWTDIHSADLSLSPYDSSPTSSSFIQFSSAANGKIFCQWKLHTKQQDKNAKIQRKVNLSGQQWISPPSSSPSTIPAPSSSPSPYLRLSSSLDFLSHEFRLLGITQQGHLDIYQKETKTQKRRDSIDIDTDMDMESILSFPKSFSRTLLPLPPSSLSAIRCAEFSSCHSKLVVGGNSPLNISLFDIQRIPTNRIIENSNPNSPSPSSSSSPCLLWSAKGSPHDHLGLPQHSPTRQIKFSISSSPSLIISATGNSFYLFDIREGGRKPQFNVDCGKGEHSTAIAMDGENHVAACGSATGKISLIDIRQNGKGNNPFGILRGVAASITQMEFLPKNSRYSSSMSSSLSSSSSSLSPSLCVISADRFIRIFNSKSKKCEAKYFAKIQMEKAQIVTLNHIVSQTRETQHKDNEKEKEKEEREEEGQNANGKTKRNSPQKHKHKLKPHQNQHADNQKEEEEKDEGEDDNDPKTYSLSHPSHRKRIKRTNPKDPEAMSIEQ